MVLERGYEGVNWSKRDTPRAPEEVKVQEGKQAGPDCLPTAAKRS